mmetsp:Transcript_25425/g.37695  ORF Transcript_25425/g.37695 Transcript_25425/m.37695 type:complete len:416 (-) Transcript_25425:148-1395(-)
MSFESCSSSWTTAIYNATACLRNQDETFLDPCLEYLKKLEHQLRLLQDETEADEWSLPPQNSPPDWHQFLQKYDMSDEINIDRREDTRNSFMRGQCQDQGNAAEKELDCRRILVRILTCQSECLAFKASSLRNSQQWQLGANQYHISLGKIHQALDVADSQISKWIMMEIQGGDYQDHIHSSKEHLIEDANIVAVAIESLTKGRDKFLQLSRKEEAYLLRKLEPQWQSRDEVKRHMGDDRWKNNPNPKFDYAKMRQEWEQRYRDVQGALQVLQTMDITLIHAREKSKQLQNQLDHGIDKCETELLAIPQQRYNRMRPDSEFLERRVSWEDYPDATEFGWEFTGSWEAAEFFEKDGIKMDWYFTSATVKTALDHPTKGKTQMFRNSVHPELYRDILKNPRVHTNQGYQTRKNNHGN